MGGRAELGVPRGAVPSLSEVPHTMPLPMRRSGDWTPLVPKSTPSLPALVAEADELSARIELARLRKGGVGWMLGCAAALLVGLGGSFAAVTALGPPRSAAAGPAHVSEAEHLVGAAPSGTVPPVASFSASPSASAAPAASAPKAPKVAPRGK